ncbi:hypothetical protein [Dactylosporangium matsuzakiense]|uniref:hypothetical protein n=1 Tax=Dactylosporangium matsuzakiense TaxID=53360 RepID=UPI0021C35E25|nr:hypothetical protein [Dactylosporangium matsuzakiense]UWZ45095.1 hypothetical protein Dmats_00550 [Dactylosporangium matsuzakiense]
MSSDVRHHRLFSPNRRPLLISALLVLLTSVPTMIVVVAGSATLETAPPPRSPVIADPQPGPVIVGSGPTSGLHASGPAGRSSGGAAPTAPQPPLRPRATSRPSEGSGGTGGGSGSIVKKAPTRHPSVESSPPPAPDPSPIQDRAWPGWDDNIKESGIHQGRSIGQFRSADSAVGGLPTGPRVRVARDDRPCRGERFARPLRAPRRAALGVPAGDGLMALDPAAGVGDGVVVDDSH